MKKIPSTIANAATRAERAAGCRRLQICVASGFAEEFPTGGEVILHVGAKRCRARLVRRRDSGALFLCDPVAAGPGERDLAGILAELGLDVGDHPELELDGPGDINLSSSGPHMHSS